MEIAWLLAFIFGKLINTKIEKNKKTKKQKNKKKKRKKREVFNVGMKVDMQLQHIKIQAHDMIRFYIYNIQDLTITSGLLF
jgi:uncharacterized membrane protein